MMKIVDLIFQKIAAKALGLRVICFDEVHIDVNCFEQ